MGRQQTDKNKDPNATEELLRLRSEWTQGVHVDPKMAKGPPHQRECYQDGSPTHRVERKRGGQVISPPFIES